MWLFLKNLLFTIFVPGMVAVFVPLRFLADDLALPDSWSVRHVLALPLLAVGIAICLRSVWSFAVEGRGTPAPIDAPKVLVVTGFYRYVRNPMYVGVLSVILGEALFFAAPALIPYAIAVAAIVHLFVVFVEEPSLEHQFGDSYRRYRAAVRRWLPGHAYRPEP